MRVLLVHNAYARPSGEEHAVQSIADLLKSHGHQVAWFTKSSSELAGSMSGNIQAFFSGIYSPRSRAEICNLLDSTPIDIVQIQNLYPQISASILKPCRDRGIPVVMRCPNYRLFCPQGLFLAHGEICERCARGHEYWCFLRNCTGSRAKSLGYAVRNAASRISRMILDSVSVFAVLSEFQRSKFIQYGIPADRLAILPNYESTSDFSASAEPGEYVAFIGRVSPEKGITQFIEAARALPHVPFAIAGNCESMPEVAAAAPHNLSIRGFLSGEALDDFYRHSRVVVCPSVWYEGFPNVVARAMAAGKPVIASRIGAMPEIVIDGETGLLFEPGDARALADCIETLLNDPGRCAKMGRLARARVEREFSPEAVYRKIMLLYAQAERESRQLDLLAAPMTS